MKLSVFCGLSVDGFLARPDDTFDFLQTGEQEPHGFKEFLASVDVVVIGRRTFDVVLKLGHLALYGKKPVVVLSGRRLDFSSAIDGVVEQMSGEPGEIVARLEARGFQHAYVDGGLTISAVPGGGIHRPTGNHARTGADRRRHSALRPSATRYPSPSRCNALV